MPHAACPAPAGRSAPPRALGALACLALAVLQASLGTSIANVALPDLATAFAVPFPAVQWVVLAYLLGMTPLMVSMGRLGDLLGRRSLMGLGMALFTLASVACGLAPGLWLLLLARAGQGLGAAVLLALSLALVGDALPPQRAGRAMGFLGAMSALGTALGPSLGGVLLATLGWRALFLLNLPLGLVGLALARQYLPPDPPRRRRAAIDLPGTLLLAGTLAAYALALTWGRSQPAPVGIALGLAAVAGGLLFVAVESRAASPLLHLGLLAHRVIGTGFVAGALVTTVAMTTLVVGPFHLALALGLGPSAVGLVMSGGPVVAALAGLPAGAAVDRFGARAMSLAGLVVMLVGCLALAWLPLSLGVPGYALPLMATTAGFALFQAANNTAVVSAAAVPDRGLVSGLLGLSRNLGLLTGASLMGAVFALGTGVPILAGAPVEALAAGTRTAFALAVALVAVALVLSAGVRDRVGAATPVA